jgi:hypothetical protein
MYGVQVTCHPPLRSTGRRIAHTESQLAAHGTQQTHFSMPYAMKAHSPKGRPCLSSDGSRRWMRSCCPRARWCWAMRSHVARTARCTGRCSLERRCAPRCVVVAHRGCVCDWRVPGVWRACPAPPPSHHAALLLLLGAMEGGFGVPMLRVVWGLRLRWGCHRTLSSRSRCSNAVAAHAAVTGGVRTDSHLI